MGKAPRIPLYQDKDFPIDMTDARFRLAIVFNPVNNCMCGYETAEHQITVYMWCLDVDGHKRKSFTKAV